MKKRLTKKWINRYINPLIENLPTTNMRGWEIDKEDGIIEWVEGLNHSIKRGYIMDEGNIVPYGGGMRQEIIRASENIKKIMSTYKHVYIRVKPETRNNRLYMRLITEKVKQI